MTAIWEWLKGKKTYITVVLALVYTLIIHLGLYPSEQWVWNLIGAGAIAAIRDALPKQ